MNFTGQPIPLPLDAGINRCLGHGHHLVVGGHHHTVLAADLQHLPCHDDPGQRLNNVLA